MSRLFLALAKGEVVADRKLRRDDGWLVKGRRRWWKKRARWFSQVKGMREIRGKKRRERDKKKKNEKGVFCVLKF